MPILEKGKMKPLVEQELLKIENLDIELHDSRRRLKALPKKQRKRFLSSLDLSEVNEDNIDEIIRKRLDNSSFTKINKAQKNHKAIIDDWVEEDLSPENEPTPLFQEKKSKKNKALSKREEVPSKKPKYEQQNIESFGTRKVKSMEPFKIDSEWNVPLQENEVEYFIPSRKLILKKANQSLEQDKLMVPNIFSKGKPLDSKKTRKIKLKGKSMKTSTPLSTPNRKKVTIALKQNASQSIDEHIKQVQGSPLIPYDASKLPQKGLLKPNSIPGPINPYYKKKFNTI